MLKKTTYWAPEADLLKVSFDENFMGSVIIDQDNNTQTWIVDGDGKDEVI